MVRRFVVFALGGGGGRKVKQKTMRVVISSTSPVDASPAHLQDIPLPRRAVAGGGEGAFAEDAWRALAVEAYKDTMEGWDEATNGRLRGEGPFRWALRLLGPPKPPSDVDNPPSLTRKVTMRSDLTWDLLRACIYHVRRHHPEASFGEIERFVRAEDVSALPTLALWPDEEERDAEEDVRKALFGEGGGGDGGV